MKVKLLFHLAAVLVAVISLGVPVLSSNSQQSGSLHFSKLSSSSEALPQAVKGHRLRDPGAHRYTTLSRQIGAATTVLTRIPLAEIAARE